MRILITAGGTGGHIFPAMSMADKLRQADASLDISFCIDGRVDRKLMDKFNYRYYLLNAPRMPYGISFRWISFLIMLFFSLFKSAAILSEINPDVVVGFGAYISGVVLAQAKRKNKKIIIHEQNVTMGRANLILSRISDRIAISFDSPEYQKDARYARYIVTGNPIRTELLEDLKALNREEARRMLDLEAGKTTILVMGGSLGSHIINTVFLKTLNSLPADTLDSLQILHLTGKSDFSDVQSAYKNINVKIKVYPFFERMGLLYKAADFVICRGGASAVAELCAFAMPAILIPYTGAGAHQLENARFLEEKGAAVMLEEKRLTPETLLKEVTALLMDDEKLQAMSNNLSSLAKIDAAEKLAGVVFSVVA